MISSKLAYELKTHRFPQTFPLGRKFYVEEELVTVGTPDITAFEEATDVSLAAAVPTILELESLVRATTNGSTLAMNTTDKFAIAVIENFSAEGEDLDEALAKLFIKRKAAGN